MGEIFFFFFFEILKANFTSYARVPGILHTQYDSIS